MRCFAIVAVLAALLSVAQGEVPCLRSLFQSRFSAARTTPIAAPYGIIPNVIDRVKPGNAYLDVQYNGTSVDSQVFSPSQLTELPQYNATGLKPGGRYLLMIVDPDAHRARFPAVAQVLHAMVANIRIPAPPPGTKPSSIELPLAAGTQVAAFLPPAPPPGSGAHRYTSLLYEQPGNKAMVFPKLQRQRFSARGFAKEYRLGDPVAVGMFFGYLPAQA